jgi:hypothetical protein
MLIVVLGAGIGLLVAGLAALGYGFLIKEFGLGNTLIQAGTVAACSGLLMVGLWAVGRELRAVAQRLGAGAAALQPPLPIEPTLAPPPRNPLAADTAAAADPTAAPPWVEDRDSAEAPPVPPPPPAEASPPVKPRRNLLFTTTSRKEREREAARSSEPLAPDLLSADLRPNPPEDAPAAPAVPAPQPANFDDAWPKADRAKPGEAPPRRSARAPSTFNEAGSNIPGREEAPQVTVLKSGVVDGMAYSLYSDGSIEAQMPEGMMRFASIDELRSHLDQRP